MPAPDAARPWRHLYNTAAWKRIRKDQLQREPLCRMCAEMGKVTAATIADHVTPHKGDEALFFGGPLQSLCKPHHDGAKQREEKSGRAVGCDVDGWPLAARGRG